MIFNTQTTLESKALKLRPLLDSDFDALFEAASNPEIWEQHPQPDRYKLETFKKYFETIKSTNGALVIIDMTLNQIIGSSSFYEFDQEKSEVVIGYTFLKKEYWGGTHNADLKNLMLNHAFNFVDNVLFHIGSQNIRSQKATQKIGGKFIFEFKKKTPEGREVRNFVYKIEKRNFNLPVLIRGSRINLRDWKLSDVEEYVKWQKPGHRWQDLDGPYYRSPEDESIQLGNELKEKIKSESVPLPRTRLVVADALTDKIIGTVSSYWESKETNWLCAGITIYDPATWGQGLGFEAMEMWINYLFKSYPQIVRLNMRTWSGNKGMIHLAEKLGFTLEAKFRKARIVNGEYYDGLGFGILKEEWLKK